MRSSWIRDLYNNYIQNHNRNGELPVYSVIDGKTVFNKNKFTQLLVDLPIEFRENFYLWEL
jgi:protein involved in sex pheromone biosynthesis